METNLETVMNVTVAPATCTVSARSLSKAINQCKKFVNRRSSLPVLTHILLTAGGGKLVVYGTNLEAGLSVTLDTTTENDFSICVPPDSLLSTIKGKENVTLTFSTDAPTKLMIGSLSIAGMKAEEFPPMPKAPDNMQPMNELPEVIAHVAYAASKDEARPVLCGVYLNEQQAVTTDGFRLAFYPTTYTGAPINIPAAGLVKLAPMLGASTTIGTMPDNKQVYIQSGNIAYVSLLIQGNYPNYKQVMGDTFTTHEHLIVVKRDELLQAIESLDYLTKELSNHSVRFNAVNSCLSLKAVNDEMGEGVVQVDTIATKGDTEIAFNAEFIKEFLRVAPDEQVKIITQSHDRPGYFVSGDSMNFVMPVHLR